MLPYIQQGVGKTIFPRTLSVKKAKEVWEILKKEFQGTDKTIASSSNLSGEIWTI